ncbi:MAG: NTP transferase domain-containing protein [Tannerellaceae bacterium]|jgi:NDP-sugar pyrophosphorylase family protein|nr:NTP transferase domain-containing protein [Tannerellaceae bacterium]
MDFAIIAAGEGSRLAEEGVREPKPLVPLHGIPLIDRLVDIFLRHGATALHVIVNEEMTEVQKHLQQMKLPIPLHLTVKSTPGPVQSFFFLSLRLRGERFCLTTVDSVFREEDFSRYLDAFREEEADALMAVTEYVDDEKPLYVHTDEQGFIRRFADQTQSRYVSGGIYGLKRSALRVLQNSIRNNELRMRHYQRRLLAEGLSLKAYPFGQILDIDHASDIEKAEHFLNPPSFTPSAHAPYERTHPGRHPAWKTILPQPCGK